MDDPFGETSHEEKSIKTKMISELLQHQRPVSADENPSDCKDQG